MVREEAQAGSDSFGAVWDRLLDKRATDSELLIETGNMKHRTQNHRSEGYKTGTGSIAFQRIKYGN